VNQQFGPLLYTISIWALPAIIAITFHEAAHGFAARMLGDDTAWRLGRVTFNPLKHIDPVGTILLPGLLILLHSPFLFGYAKPVPINFRALHNPRRDMVLVAAAGPSINVVLALVAALTFHLLGYLPDTAAQSFWRSSIYNLLIINQGSGGEGTLEGETTTTTSDQTTQPGIPPGWVFDFGGCGDKKPRARRGGRTSAERVPTHPPRSLFLPSRSEEPRRIIARP
jgi:hypothetical protein